MLSLCQDLLPSCCEAQERTGAVEDGSYFVISVFLARAPILVQLLRHYIERPFHVMAVVMMMSCHYLRQGLTMELRLA